MRWLIFPIVILLFSLPESKAEIDGPAAGLLANWPMDEGTGTNIAPSVGTVPAGTLKNGVAWANGISNKGLNLDGIDDYVSFGSVMGVPNTQSFSISIFIKTRDRRRRQQIYWEGAGRTYFSLSLTGDNLLYINSRADAELIASNSQPVPMGEWAHVVVTFQDSGASREVKFYINGVLTDTVSVSGELFLADGPAYLGTFGRIDSSGIYHFSSFFNGELDDLRFYGRTLLASEVLELSKKNLRLDQLTPIRLNLKPSGVLPAGFSPIPISLETNEAAECRYGPSPNTAFANLPATFTSRFGSTIHEAELPSVPNGQVYNAYVKCRDSAGNVNVDDKRITFSVANTQPAPSDSGRIFYMSGAGSDTNPGSITLPFKTFAKAGNILQAGDTLYVRAGVYNQVLTDGLNSGESWDKPISYRTYPGERPVLMPAADNNVVRFNLNSYVVVEGFILDALKILNYEYPVAKVTSSAHHIRFVNCEFKNSLNGMGIQMSGPRGDYVEVINSDIHDNGNVGIGTQNHGIYLSSPNCLIENNRFYRNSVWQIHGYGGNADNTIVRGNVFYDSEGAVLVSNGNNWLITNNLMFNPGRGVGIDIRDYTNITGTKILNNSINGYAIGISLSGSNPIIQGTQIINNLVYDTPYGGLTITAGGSGTLVRHNLIAKSWTSNGASFYDVGLGTITSSNLIDGGYEPRFVNPFEQNFHLLLGSPAINAGETLAEVPQDIDQHTRPQGAAFDLGSSEYGVVSGALDNQAPTVPGNLTGSALSQNRVDLSWSASSDDLAVSGYRVYRDNIPIADLNSLNHSDLGLAPGAPYTYTVAAFDARGNFSPISGAVIVSTPPAISPLPPTNLRID